MTSRANIYQRNTQSGRVVDTGPPRTATGFTGLGAVGGPTGVGAGALRAFVEFIVDYNAKELKQLEADIARLSRLEERNNKRLADLRKQQAQSEGALIRVQNIRHQAELQFNRKQLQEIKNIRDLQRSGTRGDIAISKEKTAELAKQTGFTKSQITQLVNQDRITDKANEKRRKIVAQIAQQEARVTGLQRQSVAAQERAGSIRAARAALVPRLGALALGAVGGIFGGAVVGLGFTAAQAGLEAVAEGIQNLIDPSRAAKDAIASVGNEIRKISEQDNISLLEAAEKQLKALGPAAQGISADMLALAAGTQAAIENNEKLRETLKLTGEALDELARRDAVETAKAALEAAGLSAGRGTGQILGIISRGGTQEEIARQAQFLGFTTQETSAIVQAYTQVLDGNALSAERASTAHISLAAAEAASGQAAAVAAIQQRQLSNALESASGLRISGLQDQLEAAGGSGPSARTQALTAQLEAMAEAQAQAAYGAQQAALAEERFLILLEKRIRFQGEALRLEGLSAKAQLVAVNARIARLQDLIELDRRRLEVLDEELDALRKADDQQDKRDQEALEVFDEKIEALRKQGDAQDRLNRLLDLQYRLSQTIRRQQGETIADFLARRANETRQLLAEQAELGREGAIGSLEAQRDEIEAIQEVANARRESAIEAKELERDQLEASIERVEKVRKEEIRALEDKRDRLELEVRLNENAERSKALAAQEGSRRAMKATQDALRASQQADSAALKSRQDSIRKQIQAEQDKAKEIAYWADVGNQEQLRAAIKGARTYTELSAVVGEVAGAKRALGELRALVKAGVIPARLVNESIANLVAIIRMGENALVNFFSTGPARAPVKPFAKGGIVELTNAMNNPFGANIRAGEEGSELAFIMSRKMSEALKGTLGPQLPPLSLTINKSKDPWADYQRARRLVSDTVEDLVR